MKRTSWIFALALCVILTLPRILTAQQIVEIGDVLCTDGTVVSIDEFNNSGKIAMGIVYFIFNDGMEGLAVNLHDDATDIEYGGYGEDFPIPDIEESRKTIYDFNGYNNTEILRGMYGGSYWYPAVWATDFDNGWYIPAGGEARLLYSQTLTVNKSLGAVGGIPLFANTNNYWTSTERTCYHMHDLNRQGNMGNYTKVMASNPALVGVRAVRRFNVNSMGYGIGDIITNDDGSQGVVFNIDLHDRIGWMVALNDAPSSYQWGDNTDTPLPNRQYEDFYNLLNEVFGQENTATLLNYQSNGAYAASQVDFEHGWCLPGAGQLSTLYGMLPFIEDSIVAAGGSIMDAVPYWTSTEFSVDKACAVDYGSPGYYGGNFKNKSKSEYGYVRAVREFSLDMPAPTVGQINAPAAICAGNALTLQAPETQYGLQRGWQMSPDSDFNGSQVYYGQTLDESCDGWYLRYFVGNYTGVVYSNVVQISVLSPSTSSFSINSCEPFIWNGETYTVSGDYEQVFETYNGCDSIVTCHLTIGQNYYVSFDVLSCESYIWNGVTYTESGDYDQSFTSAYGCDSIVTIHLSIGIPSASEFTKAACDSYTWNGIEYTQSGDYMQTFANIFGCDSVAIMHLTIESFETMPTIEGDAAVDSYLTPTGIYVQSGYDSAEYQWILLPAQAGAVSGYGNTAIVTWASDYLGKATLGVGVDNPCGEGFNTLTITVRNSFDVDENDAKVKVYPNPTSGDITIEANAMQHLVVMNALGQIVVERDLDADTISLDVAQFGIGVYVVRIQTRDGICTKRISVK